VSGRSPGLTALTLAFEVLAVGAFLLGLRGLSDAPPRLPASTALGLLAVFVASAAVAFGLHGRRAWTLRAARVWGASAGVVLLWFFLGPAHAFQTWTLGVPTGLALLAAGVLLERRLPAVLEARSAPPA